MKINNHETVSDLIKRIDFESSAESSKSKKRSSLGFFLRMIFIPFINFFLSVFKYGFTGGIHIAVYRFAIEAKSYERFYKKESDC